MSETVKLSKPIMAHGKEIDQLELREPSVEDLGEGGYPFLIVQSDGETQGIEVRPKVVMKYISILAGVNMAAVKSMSMNDFSKCQAVIMGFFGQGDSAGQSTEAGAS